MQALSIRGLTKTYANGVQALRGIDLDVAEGDFFALLGPNGAGKTTTIGIIVSMVEKSGGTVSVFGHDIDRALDRAKTCIGLVPQEINFNQFENVFTVISNQASFYGIPRALAVERSEKYLRQLQLWDKRDTIARSLSGGMKRRLMIARALVHEPRLLILDEPTAGVDIEIRRSMWDFLRGINAQGTTIILTTHYIEEAEEMADRVGVINKGELILVEEKTELMKKLGRKVLHLQLAEPLQAIPSELAEWRLELSEDGSQLTFEFDAKADRTGVPSLLAAMRDAGIAFKDLDTHQSSLEDIFVGLIHEKKAAA